jgi:presenilin-like A22 family membrane protease
MHFDIGMPLTLFFVTLLSMFLNRKTEGKLKSSLEEREFAVKDVILLVAAMAGTVSVIVFVPQMAIMALFLFSYSTLLFSITYIFSNKRWYLAVLSPAIFILLFIFLRDTAVWSDYLVNVYGLVFAVLITLYMGGLFTWKTGLVFGGILTVMDIILVLVTGAMITMAKQTVSLKLPVIVWVPMIPLVMTEGGRLVPTGLGLGDFFFAGLLAIQTWKELGKKSAILSAAMMATSFFIFETVLLAYGPINFPGTLIIICGWLPLVLWKKLRHQK